MSEYPQCPNCETNLLVGKTNANVYRYECYGCHSKFGHIDTEPIAWDRVDRWYQIDSEFSATIHASDDCGSIGATDKPIMHLTSEEAETHHLGRCRKCGWEEP